MSNVAHSNFNMNTKIYVGNLLYEITDDELKQLFLPYGEVISAEIVRYKKSRRSKGFGYVKMGTTDQAQQAMTALNDQDYRGRRLFLQPAKSDDPPAEVVPAQESEAQEVQAPSPEPVEGEQTGDTPSEMQSPQNFTPHEGLSKSGTIFSSRDSNNSDTQSTNTN